MVKSHECELVTRNSESEMSFQYFEPKIKYAFVLFKDSNRKILN